MASKMQQVADAVVLLIEAGEAAGTFAQSIVTERIYETDLALEDTDIISVLVMPALSNRTRKSQGTWNRDVALDIIVRKRFPQSAFNSDGKVEKESVDPYVDLLEQIDDWLAKPANHVLTSYTDAVYIEDDSKEADSMITRDLGIRFAYLPEHLTTMHQYTGVLRVAYHVEVEYE
jgi:hypothetical protein